MEKERGERERREEIDGRKGGQRNGEVEGKGQRGRRWNVLPQIFLKL